MNALKSQIFELSEKIRYVAIYKDGVLISSSKQNLQNTSSSESDKYEELIVNPALLTLATQRGNIDCGGCEYILVRHGHFFEYMSRIKDGHVSVGIEPNAEIADLAIRLKKISESSRMMRGRILQINISKGGVPKMPVGSAFVSFERVDGDDWRHKDVHGGAQQVILMIAQENIDALKTSGFPVFPGALGENFTTKGLDYKTIRYGDVFKAGEALEFRITKRRAPCRTILVYGSSINEAIFDKTAHEHDWRSEKWGVSGFYAEILKEGSVKAGDTIERIKES